MKTRLGVILLATVLCFTGTSLAQDDKPVAPLFNNLGALNHPVTTKSERAQHFFNQGLRLAYAFNHAEAIRAFKEAARLDPDCAMAYWGEALALGPNINDAMPFERELEAYAALQKAIARKSNCSEKEKAYIDALAKRYSNSKDRNRSALDSAYAEAMAEVSRRYPDDLDAATLYAEALMDMMPWNYWNADGTPKPDTAKVIAILESVMKRNPDHPGAHHYYIHAVEASPDPDRGIPSADRLGNLMPGAGHLVHMPAHIYIRVGRYDDASQANIRAIAADEDYITQCRAQGIYPLGYYPHNIHFLWSSLTWEGRSNEAISSAIKIREKVSGDNLHQHGSEMLQNYWVTPYFAFTRFGKWDEILKEAQPPKDFHYPTGVWHYARGIARAAKGRLKEADEELNKLMAVARHPSLTNSDAWGFNPASNKLAIATETLAGEIAAKRGETNKAVTHLKKAVELEDKLIYNEPPDWHYPVRQSLGAVLLDAGRAAEAEAVYREDLKRNRENGWSLFGLLKSLRMQGKSAEADEAEKRFQKAWERADITLTSSRF